MTVNSNKMHNKYQYESDVEDETDDELGNDFLDDEKMRKPKGKKIKKMKREYDR